MSEPTPAWMPPWEAGMGGLAGLALMSAGVLFHLGFAPGDPTIDSLLEQPLAWTLLGATPLFAALGWLLGDRRRERVEAYRSWQASTTEGMRDLAQREYVTRGILQTAFDAVLILDDDLVIVDANPIAARIFGWPLDKLVGSEADVVLPEHQQLGNTLAIERRTAGGEVLGKEWQTRAKHRSGHSFPVDLNMLALREHGLLLYVAREASTRVRAEQKRLDAARAELLGRTSAVRRERGMRLLDLGDALRGGVDRTFEEIEALAATGNRHEGLEQAAYGLVERLEKLHELSMWERGDQSITMGSILVGPLVERVAAAVTPIARRRGNHIVVRIDDAVSAIDTDGLRLASALRALVANAAVHCTDSTITLEVMREPGRRSDWVAIYVQDTGKGLSEERLARIYSLLASEPRELMPPPVDGLGITLAHRLARALGGHLSVESPPGHGCTFTLRVPESITFTHEPATPRPIRLDSGA